MAGMLLPRDWLSGQGDAGPGGTRPSRRRRARRAADQQARYKRVKGEGGGSTSGPRFGLFQWDVSRRFAAIAHRHHLLRASRCVGLEDARDVGPLPMALPIEDHEDGVGLREEARDGEELPDVQRLLEARHGTGLQRPGEGERRGGGAAAKRSSLWLARGLAAAPSARPSTQEASAARSEGSPGRQERARGTRICEPHVVTGSGSPALDPRKGVAWRARRRARARTMTRNAREEAWACRGADRSPPRRG